MKAFLLTLLAGCDATSMARLDREHKGVFCRAGHNKDWVDMGGTSTVLHRTGGLWPQRSLVSISVDAGCAKVG